MVATHLIKLAKMKGKMVLLNALKHNKRTLQAERGFSAHIDPTRTSLNYSLTGIDTPEKLDRFAKSQMALAGIDRPRSNQVMGIEVLFSLPINRQAQDTTSFFTACFEWVKLNFAGVLISFDVHLDESAPHAHAIILPLVDGKMQGSAMMGGIGNLKRLINNFHNDVALHYGLSQAKRLSKSEVQSLTARILERLKSDPAKKSVVWDCFKDSIRINPIPYAQLLSIQPSTLPRTSSKSFVDHMRSHGKGSFIR
jgi:hypothetical protein